MIKFYGWMLFAVSPEHGGQFPVGAVFTSTKRGKQVKEAVSKLLNGRVFNIVVKPCGLLYKDNCKTKVPSWAFGCKDIQSLED